MASRMGRKAWRFVQKLSVWQLVPLGLFFYGRGCVQNYRLENNPGAAVQSAVFAPDGQTLYGGGSRHLPGEVSGLLRAWDARTGKTRWERKTSGFVRVHDVSDDGRRLVASSAPQHLMTGLFCVFDTRTGAKLYQFPNEQGDGARGACLAPDGGSVVLVYSSGVECWRLTPGEPTFKWRRDKTELGDEMPVWLAQSGGLLVVRNPRWASDEALGGVEMWSLRDGKTVRTFAKGSDFSAAVTPDEKRVLIAGTGSGRGMSLYDVKTGQARAGTAPFTDGRSLLRVESVAPHEKGVQVRVRYRDYDDHTARLVWNLRTDAVELKDVRPQSLGVLSPDGKVQAVFHTGNGKHQPPLVTLSDASTDSYLRSLEGEAGWRPNP